jgi:uncharacterized protein (DUF58 family)
MMGEATISPEIQKNGTEPGLSTKSAGYLLSKYGLLAILACLLLAAWYGQVVIVIVLGLLLSAAGLSRLWSQYSLKGVHCQHFLNEKRAFPGEYLELKLQLDNRKILPLPWIQVDDEVPLSFLHGVSVAAGNRPGSGLLSKATALLWYTRASWQQRLYCEKRGYYTLGPVTITSGDIFGFYPRSITEPLIEHVIVYPRIYPVALLGIPSMNPLGDAAAERRIFEDPTRVIGVRDYTPHDSLRRIHWKATARHQNLQVKVFEPTTTLKVALFMAVDSFSRHGGYLEEDLELAISTAASVANYVIAQGSLVGLFTNTCLADSGGAARIPSGSGINQLVSILEALAKVTASYSHPFQDFLQGELKNLPWGTTLIFIISTPSKPLTGLLIDLKERGYRILVLQVGNQPDADTSHAIAWHYIRNPGDMLVITSRVG